MIHDDTAQQHNAEDDRQSWKFLKRLLITFFNHLAQVQ